MAGKPFLSFGILSPSDYEGDPLWSEPFETEDQALEYIRTHLRITELSDNISGRLQRE